MKYNVQSIYFHFYFLTKSLNLAGGSPFCSRLHLTGSGLCLHGVGALEGLSDCGCGWWSYSESDSNSIPSPSGKAFWFIRLKREESRVI